MRRREFLWLVGFGPAASWSCSVLAQQTTKVYRIAIVVPAGPVSRIGETYQPNWRAFFGELRRLGYIEGQNLVVERHSAEGHPERYPELVGAVVRSNPDAVYISTLSLAREFKTQTTTVPIVANAIDPVALGLAESLARPGGNFTGTYAPIEIWGKRLDLLKETIPTLSRVGLLMAPTLVAQRAAAMLKEASEKKGIRLVGSPLTSPFDETAYRRAFAAMVEEGAEAVYVADQYESWPNRDLIVELAEKHRLPAIYPMPEAVKMGGLMAYAIDYADQNLHIAAAIDQIFRGTNPGDIPFYQATKFDLLINLKTATALGIEISPNLLARATTRRLASASPAM
jgi:putative ABC transport system substrate-binding protein